MAKPQHWGPSKLDTFVNCPEQFHHKYVLKDVPREQTEQMDYGLRVHKAFEDRMNDGVKLPPDLAMHEAFLGRLEARAGVHWCEAKVALTRDLRCVEWDGPDPIWWQGIIDFRKVDAEDPRASIVDYKTGKPHNKFEQLGQYALHTFLQFPKVDIVDVRYYWTQTCSVTRKVWSRSEMDDIWDLFLSDLRQYAEAFKTDVWQKRPSGLCNGYCPVKTCEHWKPLRPRRY